MEKLKCSNNPTFQRLQEECSEESSENDE